jgi:hypothetical protein
MNPRVIHELSAAEIVLTVRRDDVLILQA